MGSNSVYASTAGLARHFRTLPEMLAAFTGAGIDHIELGWAPPVNGLVLPHGLTSLNARWLVHNYFPAPAQPFVLNLAAQDERALRHSRDFATAAIRLSAALGAPFYSIHCGFLAEFEPSSLGRQLNYSEICDYERGYTTFRESLHHLLREARAANIRLLIEPNVVSSFNLINGRNLLLMMALPEEFSRLLSDLADDRLGVLLDLGHLKVTAATLGFTIAEFVDVVAPAVGAFHIHDNDGTLDQHLPVSTNSWIFDVLRQSRFRGIPVVNEAKFESVAAMVEHCIWLKKTLHF
jgi:sugar phosphate isomerase/epimerase